MSPGREFTGRAERRLGRGGAGDCAEASVEGLKPRCQGAIVS